jgi:PBP1b-binding outer membrane lipoprotein LpoB
MNNIKYIAFLLLSMALTGCSSAPSEQEKLELLAQKRALMITAELPIESGPLAIMRAVAKKNIIEIMMIYNVDAEGAKPITEVIAQSVKSYCTQDEIKSNLDAGLAYRINMRDSRGKLIVDQMVTKESCLK